MTVYEVLNGIQMGLKAPKNQMNKFGGYKYRSLEDIQEALKPLLKGDKAVVLLTDDVVEVGSRIYIKATATLRVDKEEVSVTAFARESETKKGMDDSQITGSASSYARKYAMNGLFAIDDTKDADFANNGKSEPEKAKQAPTPKKASGEKAMSEPQRKKLWAMMKNKEMSNAEAKSFYEWMKADREHLTMKEASEYIENFEGYFGKFTGLGKERTEDVFGDESDEGDSAGYDLE